MAFDQQFFSPVGANATESPSIYSYTSTDNATVISSADYFQEKENQLEAGDHIAVNAGDGSAFIIYRGAGNSSKIVTGTFGSIVFISDDQDFDIQDSTSVTLEGGKLYIQIADIVTNKKIIAGEKSALTGGSLSSPMWEYTGTDNAIEGEDLIRFHHFNHTIKASNAPLGYSLSDTTPGTTLFQMENVLWLGTASELAVEKIGTFTDLQVVDIVNSSCSGAVTGAVSLGCNDGITITGTTTIVSIQKFAALSFSPTYIGLDWRGSTITAFEVSNFFHLGFTAGAIGFAADRNSVNMVPGSKGAISGCEFFGPVSATPLLNITSRDIRYDFKDSPPISDSTVKGILQFSNSALVTTMAAAATPTHINAVWSDGNVEERLCFQDKLIFDGATDTCTTANGPVDATGGAAFNHNLTEGDIIRLVENGGLPTGLSEGTEYYVGSLTATTFQLFPDDTLTTPVDFTGNGTEPNYYCHETGSSASGWFVYLGEERVSLDIEGWVSVEKSSGGNSEVRTVIMKTDTSFNVTRFADGAKVEARNNITGASQVTHIINFDQGEGFIIYIENVTGTNNNDVTDGTLVCSKA